MLISHYGYSKTNGILTKKEGKRRRLSIFVKSTWDKEKKDIKTRNHQISRRINICDKR